MDDFERGSIWFEAGTRRLKRVCLEGHYVRLIPLALDQAPALAEAAADPEIWRWHPHAAPEGVEGMRKVIEEAQADWEAGLCLPFAIQDFATKALLGCTRYLNVDYPNRRLEIGSTWLRTSAQRGQANPEAKLMLLAHAFDGLACLRVEFKTDALNERSRGALGKLGARQEGILRQHLLTASGRLRDSVYFSILPQEWPLVRTGLQQRLGL